VAEKKGRSRGRGQVRAYCKTKRKEKQRTRPRYASVVEGGKKERKGHRGSQGGPQVKKAKRLGVWEKGGTMNEG